MPFIFPPFRYSGWSITIIPFIMFSMLKPASITETKNMSLGKDGGRTSSASCFKISISFFASAKRTFAPRFNSFALLLQNSQFPLMEKSRSEIQSLSIIMHPSSTLNCTPNLFVRKSLRAPKSVLAVTEGRIVVAATGRTHDAVAAEEPRPAAQHTGNTRFWPYGVVCRQ